MTRPIKHFYEFGSFRLDVTERVLLRDGEPVALTPKSFDTLLVLVQNSGHVLERDELMEMVWPDAIVEENNLRQSISALRKALGDSPNTPQYIETIPRRGYRFVASVRELWDESDDLIVVERVRSRVLIEEEEEVDEEQPGSGEAVGRWGGGEFSPAPRLPRSPALLLPRLFVLLLVGLATVLSYFWISSRSKPAETGAAVRSIAVLPFKPLVAEGNDEYLGLGLADALIAQLSNLRQLIVRPTSAVRQYTALEQDPVAVGRELKVDSVLDGTIQRLGDRIRVTVQLLSISDGAPLWAETFDATFTDIFAVQDIIAERVARALTLRLTGAELKQLTKHDTESAEAYQAYLKGRYFWNKRTYEGFKKSIEYFQQAIERDPNYVLAYAGLADCYNMLADYTFLSPEEAFPKAEAAVTRALEIDDTLAEAHASLAYIRLHYHWDWIAAEREYKRAIALNPNYATAHQWYGLYLTAMGRFEEAIAEMKRAQALDPISLIITMAAGRPFYYARQYDQAIEQYQKALEMDSHFGVAHITLGWAYEQKGMVEKALTEFQKAVTLPVDSRAATGHAYAMLGEGDKAMAILDELKELSKHKFVSPYYLAILYTGLNRKDDAFIWLENAYRERSHWLIFLNVEPAFDSLRSDPRFAELVRRVGFPLVHDRGALPRSISVH